MKLSSLEVYSTICVPAGTPTGGVELNLPSPAVIVCLKPITPSWRQTEAFLDAAARAGKPLLLFAPGFDHQFDTTTRVNAARGTLHAATVAVHFPGMIAELSEPTLLDIAFFARTPVFEDGTKVCDERYLPMLGSVSCALVRTGQTFVFQTAARVSEDYVNVYAPALPELEVVAPPRLTRRGRG